MSVTVYLVEHGGKGGNNGGVIPLPISTDGAQDIIQAGKAKGYYSRNGLLYYVRLNSRNNYERILSILNAYVTFPN